MRMQGTLASKNYTALFQEQRRIARAVSYLSLKLKVLGTISDFDRLAKRGRSFARRRGISQEMVLKND